MSLIGSAMGHFAQCTERLIIKLNENKKDKYINIFYLLNNGFEFPVSNRYLLFMWKRIIPVLPLFFSPYAAALDFLLGHLTGEDSQYNIQGKRKYYLGLRFGLDNDGYLIKKNPLLSFTEFEHKKAAELLATINFSISNKFVCLMVRSAEYNAIHPFWNCFPERNSDINTYTKACLYLAEKGYHVLRMGKTFDDNFKLNHFNIIDYAKSSIRSDFLDVYLAAHSTFFIGTNTGLECIAEIFRRPILVTNAAILTYLSTAYPHHLIIFKTPRLKKSGELISYHEFLKIFAHVPTSKLNALLHQNELFLLDNTEEELLEAIIEMDSRLSETWVETDADKELQKKFIDVCCELNGDEIRKAFYVKAGRNFLLKNSLFLSSKQQTQMFMPS